MKDRVVDEIKRIFEISTETEIEFKELYGFTFAFMKNTVAYRNTISSASIKPLGIIYEENDEYYFAPLDRVDNMHAIIKKYVDEMM